MTVRKETMMTYVEETPKVTENNIGRATALVQPLKEEFLSGEYETIWIVASGSSCNAAWCARPFMRKYLGMEVKIVTPYTFIACEHDIREKDFIFVVSQSGYSTNSIEAMRVIREQGRKAIALTGDCGSDIREVSDLLVDYGAGEETVGYVTKGVTALALYLMLFALETAYAEGKLPEKEKELLYESFCKVPGAQKQVTEQTLRCYEENKKLFTSMQNAYTIGCGAGYGVAMEGALKIGETIQIPAAAYESEEYIHGPNLQLTPNYTVFAVDCGGRASARIRLIAEATRTITDRVFLLTVDRQQKGRGVIYLDQELEEEILPLAALPFFQIISYRVTEDMHRWKKHPLFAEMEKIAASKTENYIEKEES